MSEDDIDKDHESGRAEPSVEVSPMDTAVVLVDIGTSETGLVVEALALLEFR